MEFNIFDCTIRDGSNAVDFNFTEEMVRTILRSLERGGVRWVDLGHGLGTGAREKSGKPGILSELDYLRIAKEELKTASYGMFFLAKFGEKRHIDLLVEHGCRFIRIGSNITEIDQVEHFVRYAKEKGLYVNICLMKAYAVDLPDYISVIKKADSWGLDLITVMDSAGTMMPVDVKERIVQGNLHTQNAKMGFHAHNNLQMAVCNILTAVESGAASFDASVGGLGRSAGNAPIEIATLVLKRHGYETGLDYKILSDLNDTTIYPLLETTNRFSSQELTFGYAGFHSGFFPIVEKVMQQYEMLDVRDVIIALSAKEQVAVSENLVEETAESLVR